MDTGIAEFEWLPNEIIIEIFKMLDARDVFRGFYNLNFRLNILLQSTNHCLTTVSSDTTESDNDETYFPYIHTLIIKNGVDTKVDHLINVRRAILHYCSTSAMRNLQLNLASSIEHLSVLSNNSWLLSFTTDFIQKIFSNTFPYLKSCCFCKKAIILSNEKWTQSPSIQMFTIGYIRSKIYKSILSSCPNLYYLKFSKWPMEPSTSTVEAHVNLKHLVIDVPLDDFLNIHSLQNYLLSIPKLEKLEIRITLRNPQSVISIEDCDWFAKAIECYFPMLREFSCDLTFTPATNISEDNNNNFLNKLRENFQQKHKDRYQSKISFKFL